jgi:TolB-like protein/DNA-binding winged helix-turn-helix (wHTH) protein/Flp pilus assembly protein TadD
MGDQPSATSDPQRLSGNERVQFGIFEADLRSGELRKRGLKVKLHGQPFAVLAMLLERPGEVITREELQKKLWPVDTFVDFEHGLNKAINKLREALGDKAENPRFIETLPRKGYRFVAPIRVPGPTGSATAADTTSSATSPQRRVFPWRLGLVTGVSALALVAVMALYLRNRPADGPRSVGSIAVLPFSDLSPQNEQSYFADGMTEALISNLSQLGPLRVISRTSAMRYKDTGKPINDIARELNVDAIVEGSVLSTGDRVRISVNLVDGRTDQTLWSQQYERELRSVLTLQREVTQVIAHEIRIKATPLHTKAASNATVDPEAYRLYLRGMQARYRDEPEQWRAASEWFEKSAARDPNFAPAHVGLATAYTLLGGFTPYISRDEAASKAQRAITRALELDSTLAGAHLANGLFQEVFMWDWAEAERAFRRSIESNPGLSEARHEHGLLLMRLGRFDEARREIQLAIQQDPRAAFLYHSLANVYVYQGQYDAALEEFRNALNLAPDNLLARSSQGETYVLRGDISKAIEALNDDNVLRASAWAPGYLVAAYAAAGRHDDARRTLQNVQDNRDPHQKFAAWTLALAYAGTKQPAQACASLRKAVHERSGVVIFIKVEPLFASLRSQPCYQDLLRKVGLD